MVSRLSRSVGWVYGVLSSEVFKLPAFCRGKRAGFEGNTCEGTIQHVAEATDPHPRGQMSLRSQYSFT